MDRSDGMQQLPKVFPWSGCFLGVDLRAARLSTAATSRTYARTHCGNTERLSRIFCCWLSVRRRTISDLSIGQQRLCTAKAGHLLTQPKAVLVYKRSQCVVCPCIVASDERWHFETLRQI